MPPVARPVPSFVASSSQEGIPYGRFAEILGDHLRERAAAIEDLPAGVEVPTEIAWFPERAWGGRVWIPAAARADSEDGPIEIFGHVSYVQPAEGDPTDFQAKADFTGVLAEDNPDWRIDLNDDVIGRWRADGNRGGDVTLVWGLPLIRGAVAATAELDGEVLDQAAVTDGRFSLVAVDAVHGFGDDLYLEIRLWDRGLREIASESLYDEE
ncbi:MAG TPA: hypothetical protein VHJ54_00770 [Solirubrobacterales bacterium]|nr:hypothetical protein [Solirubrobacterales bacterium]